MDYAERGAVEKTFDQLLDDETGGIEWVREAHPAQLVEDEGRLTTAGQLYAEGVLTGMLSTLRTFLDDPPEFLAEDAEEIEGIIRRRQAELAARLLDEQVVEASED